MGTSQASFEVAASPDGPREQVDALVASGATYTLLPKPFLERLGAQRRPKRTSVLADGTVHALDTGLVWVRRHAEEHPSLVVFGPEDAQPLPGAVTLEEFALGIDLPERELVPVRGYLVGLTPEGSP